MSAPVITIVNAYTMIRDSKGYCYQPFIRTTDFLLTIYLGRPPMPLLAMPNRAFRGRASSYYGAVFG